MISCHDNQAGQASWRLEANPYLSKRECKVKVYMHILMLTIYACVLTHRHAHTRMYLHMYTATNMQINAHMHTHTHMPLGGYMHEFLCPVPLTNFPWQSIVTCYKIGTSRGQNSMRKYTRYYMPKLQYYGISQHLLETMWLHSPNQEPHNGVTNLILQLCYNTLHSKEMIMTYQCGRAMTKGVNILWKIFPILNWFSQNVMKSLLSQLIENTISIRIFPIPDDRLRSLHSTAS